MAQIKYKKTGTENNHNITKLNNKLKKIDYNLL